jgi:Protein of unknown function (DUF2510)
MSWLSTLFLSRTASNTGVLARDVKARQRREAQESRAAKREHEADWKGRDAVRTRNERWMTIGPHGMADTVAGWYEDPWHEAYYRYWDGSAWTAHLQTTP